jgi:signal transduction histidine kinase/CheY-like chemotaxis protein
LVRTWLSNWKTLLAAIVASAIFLAMAGSLALHEHEIYNRYAVERLQQQAAALTTASATLLNEVDQTLLFISGEVADLSDSGQLRPRLFEAMRAGSESTQLPSAIFALDPEGRVFVTNSSANPDAFPLGDVDYAKAHIEEQVDGVFVGAARLGRLGNLAGRWIIGLSRAVRNDDGSLVAIIVATIPTERLSPVLASSYGNVSGIGTWIALDGRVVLRDPFLAESIVNQSDDQRRYNQQVIAADPAGTATMQSYVDGVQRVIAWERSSLFPISTAVAVASSELMSEWDRAFAIGLILSVMFCATLLLGGYFIDRLRIFSAREKQLAMDRFEHLLSGIKDIFVAVDRDLKITEFNAAAAGALDSSDPKGRSLFELFPELEERHRHALANAVSGGQRAQLQLYQPASGDTFSLHIYPFLMGAAILAERVTERMSIEARLHQSQKMEALGQLTGGIAHDFNNLLTIIVGNAEALLDENLGQEGRRNAEGIVHGAEQAAELTRQLLAFARQQPLMPRSLDLNSQIIAMEGMLRRVLPESIIFELDLHEVWPVWVDPSQLESALLNIVINARDAMPDGGKILIETSGISVEQRDDILGADLKVGQYVKVSVTDTGIGMSPEILARAFDPFFSTKPEGSGTGLGLSMVYGFARQSGGQASLYSEVGLGTTITLYLPRSLQNFSTIHISGNTMQKEPPVSGTETILIVEDNPLVREFARSALRQLGYVTVEASDAVAAIALFDSGGQFDLVLSDIVLPGDMSGPALVEALWKREHRFALLFMSGYPKSALKTAASLGEVEVLGKPFKRDVLARAVRAALQRRSHQ